MRTMKISHAIGMMILAVIVTIAIEESRIAGLRAQLQKSETAERVAPGRTRPEQDAADRAADLAATRSTRVAERPAPGASPTPSEDAGDFGKSVRKMWENPAGKSMLNQGVKMAVAMMYEDFIDSLDLTKEEADYFRDLLGAEIANQQEFGMKLMSATAEEREELMKEMERRRVENEEAIKTFLNNEEDHKRFEAYKDRLPERQQMDGLRAAMAGKDASMDGETESRLIEAMHRARKQPDVKDLSGISGMKALADGNMTEVFEKSWETQQAALRKEVSGILNEKQQEAFFEYQEQMKEFQIMSLKMAEKMMAPGETAE